MCDRAAVARGLARGSAHDFAACVQHPTDLGVLWSINTSTVIGTEVLQQYLANLQAYFDGREYWAPVEWSRLFDSYPYPAFELEAVTDAGESHYEPG